MALVSVDLKTVQNVQRPFQKNGHQKLTRSIEHMKNSQVLQRTQHYLLLQQAILTKFASTRASPVSYYNDCMA